MNVLDVIDVPTIREYNKGTVFTPAKQAVLIVNSIKTSMKEKMEALRELVDCYSEEEFQKNSVHTNLDTGVNDKI